MQAKIHFEAYGYAYDFATMTNNKSLDVAVEKYIKENLDDIFKDNALADPDRHEELVGKVAALIAPFEEAEKAGEELPLSVLVFPKVPAEKWKDFEQKVVYIAQSSTDFPLSSSTTLRTSPSYGPRTWFVNKHIPLFPAEQLALVHPGIHQALQLQPYR